MQKPSYWTSAGVLVLLALGCESRPPAADSTPQTRPVAEKPAGSNATNAAPETAQTPEPTEPELPEYLTLLDRFDVGQPVRLDVLAAADRRLVIDTRNVRRLRIARDKLPFRHDRSIALILDRQGIEWRADSAVTEFERSANGVWVPVKPD